jgi:hypothetical protein
MEWTVVLAGPAKNSLKRILAGRLVQHRENALKLLFKVFRECRGPSTRINFAFAKLMLRSGSQLRFRSAVLTS